MKPIAAVLNRVFTTEYYRLNAGFFLLVIGICFGFLRDVEHLALGMYFTSSPWLMFIPIAVWLVYALKVLSFNHHAVRKPENAFVFAAALARPSLATALVLISALQFMPALMYGGFLIVIATRFSQFTAIVMTGLAFLVCLLLIWGRLYRDIVLADSERKVAPWLRAINLNFTRPFIWFYPAWIIRRQPGLAIGTKAFAMLIIFGVTRLYLYDAYDERLFGMGCAVAFASNLVLIFFYQRFENFHFSLLRGLPLTRVRRLWNFIVICILLQLPEFSVMINYTPRNVSSLQLASVYLFALSVNLLGYASLFIRDITLELVVRRVFAASLLWIVLILFKVPVLLIALLQVILALQIYLKYYYTFEFDATIDSEK